MDPVAPGSPAAAAPASPDAAASGRTQRRVRNLLVDGPLQLRLGAYLVLVALALSVGLGWLLWEAWRETSQVIALGAPDVGGTLAQALASEDRGRALLVAAALTGVLACLLGAAVVVTHRIAGPAFAIGRTCRRVAEGRLVLPPPLRSRDLLTDLADEATAMVVALRDREARERVELQAAADALRDPAASPERRGAAAEALLVLVRQKEERLRP